MKKHILHHLWSPTHDEKAEVDGVLGTARIEYLDCESMGEEMGMGETSQLLFFVAGESEAPLEVGGGCALDLVGNIVLTDEQAKIIEEYFRKIKELGL